MSTSRYFDVLVVGGGHAGIEASLAANRMGCITAIITMDMDAIGRMSCNPAIGGSAKGHLVREIDALGGEMGRIADHTGIHFRMLNRSKGPAIWSPRCQNDRDWYNREARRRILDESGLTVIRGSALDLLIEAEEAKGVVTDSGEILYSTSIVLCTGTFLNAVMYTGLRSTAGGRYGEGPACGLSDSLFRKGLRTGRLKTGTPPRVAKHSIDFGDVEEQTGDPEPVPFSFRTDRIRNEQIPMYLTHTSMETHEILRLGFDESPMFTGRITGVGPRYCPSIEDKINRFSDRERHQIFLEPEGYESDVVYINGFSTSLPAEIQYKALRSIPGLRNCTMLRPGYAVEYDFFPPHQLEHTLETKAIKGLFFAGQINGTSGYEEAAGQGLVAGINAALRVKKDEPLILKRSESYIGVMVDDLINKGTDEPYRIFTSRAEYRLLLRQDNADSRLMRKGHSLGLIDSTTVRRLDEKERRITEGIDVLKSLAVTPTQINDLLLTKGSEPITENTPAEKILRRPEVQLADLLSLEFLRGQEKLAVLELDRVCAERVEIEVKYEGYLRRQDESIRAFEKYEELSIPVDFAFNNVTSLSREGREKLQRVRPRSIGQATRISGVTPADISVLMVALRRLNFT